MASSFNLQGVYTARKRKQSGRSMRRECEITKKKQVDESLIQTAASHLVLIPMTVIIPPVLVRPPSRRWLAVELGERRILGGGHPYLAVGTMGMDHVGTVRLGSVREERGRIELRRLRIPLLFTVLPMSVVVRRRHGCDVELGVVSWGLTRFWSGWGRELPVESRRVTYWCSHVGGHRRGRRGRGHAWCNRHALLLWRVGSVDIVACVISIKVRKERNGGGRKMARMLRKRGRNVARKTKTHLFHRASCRGHVSHPFSSPFAESRRTLQRCRT